jgi:four helix bundle protein
METVTEVYRLSRFFPKEEVYGLTSQMRRCAVSIPSNIAEGYGRNSTSDYIRFLRVGMGSLYELQTQAEIAMNLGYLDAAEFDAIAKEIAVLGRMLGSLIRRLDEGGRTNRQAKSATTP